jgi:hypothetical protein
VLIVIPPYITKNNHFLTSLHDGKEVPHLPNRSQRAAS